ncbi:MAG: hypothetical protein QF535_18900, partial [Anaerolineales bacterium]|nr:hypothetical protein [Anaerolineales bacterium]
IAEIAEGEKDEIDHLRRHYTESSWGEGASLVFLEGATLPVYSEGLFSHSDPQTIRDLTKKYGRDQWGFQIGIKDDRLHPYDEIKDEMERQLHTVGLLRDTRFQDHLNDTVELFYTAIGESEAPIGDIPDESQEHLTNQAKQTVDLYRMCNELRERDDSSPFADLMETLNGLRGMRIIYTDLSSSPEEETQQ